MATNLISNGDFATVLTDWDDKDTGAAASIWASGAVELTLFGVGTSAIEQDVVVVANTQCKLEVDLTEDSGAVDLSIFVGSSSGGSDIFSQTYTTTTSPTETFTPGVATIYLTFDITTGSVESAKWIVDNVVLTQGSGFPKTIFIG
jgi:hypothetical protein